MSRNEKIFAVIALLWLAIWSAGTAAFFREAKEQAAEGELLARPPTPIERGAALRVEGVIEDGRVVAAPFSKTACVAAEARLYYVTWYQDSDDKTHYDSKLVTTKRAGLSDIGIVADGQRLSLPLDRWVASNRAKQTTTTMDEPPAVLGATKDELSRAAGAARGSFHQFEVVEVLLLGGSPVFVAGALSSSDGPFVIEPDRDLGRVELYPGTQAALVEDVRGSSKGMRIAGFVFAGLAVTPLIVLAIVVSRRRLRQKAQRPMAPPGSALPIDDGRE